IEGRPAPPPGSAPGSGSQEQGQTAGYFSVTPNFFGTMKIPILRGRDFNARDTAAGAPVLIINQTMARRFFPNEEPVGKRITLDFVPDERPREIVAVVGDTSLGPLNGGREPVMYVPHVQQTSHFVSAQVYTRTWMNFVVRTP